MIGIKILIDLYRAYELTNRKKIFKRKKIKYIKNNKYNFNLVKLFYNK